MSYLKSYSQWALEPGGKWTFSVPGQCCMLGSLGHVLDCPRHHQSVCVFSFCASVLRLHAWMKSMPGPGRGGQGCESSCPSWSLQTSSQVLFPWNHNCTIMFSNILHPSLSPQTPNYFHPLNLFLFQSSLAQKITSTICPVTKTKTWDVRCDSCCSFSPNF